MLKPVYANQFKRDLKLIKKRGKNIRKLKSIITDLYLLINIKLWYLLVNQNIDILITNTDHLTEAL